MYAAFTQDIGALDFVNVEFQDDKWFNCAIGKKFKMLVRLQMKYVRQDRLYHSWLEPQSEYVEQYSKIYDQLMIRG